MCDNRVKPNHVKVRLWLSCGYVGVLTKRATNPIGSDRNIVVYLKKNFQFRKILDLEKNLVPKKFWSEKNVSPEKNWVRKNLGQEIFWVWKNFGFEKLWCLKNFGFGKFFGLEEFLVRKNVGFGKILGLAKLWVWKTFGLENFWVQKILGPENFGSIFPQHYYYQGFSFVPQNFLKRISYIFSKYEAHFLLNCEWIDGRG